MFGQQSTRNYWRSVLSNGVERKSVFTFQPIKRLVSKTVNSANPAAMFQIILLRTKNRQICCLAVIVHIVLPGRRVVTTKKKSNLLFGRFFSANQIEAHPNPHQNTD